jgi:putative SOS response-associated peptidase YedK
LVSASVWGTEGRGFESRQPDHYPGSVPTTVRGVCGRFTSTTSPSDLAAHFGAELFGAERFVPDQLSGERAGASDPGPRWNVAPTTDVWVVRTDDGRRVLQLLRWGLVPSWADSPAVGARMINARAETVASKPSFRRAFRSRRCVIPADGFYEWAVVPGQRRKQPWYFTDPGGRPLAMAGLHERWELRSEPAATTDGIRVLHTCAVITTSADDIVGPVHERMPVVLDGDAVDVWLDPTVDDPRELEALLSAARRNGLVARPVGTSVNRVTNDGPDLIAEMVT